MRRKHGNDTIDRYPLTYRRKLKKLLCISKEVFNKLKAALNEFGFRPKPAINKLMKGISQCSTSEQINSFFSEESQLELSNILNGTRLYYVVLIILGIIYPQVFS